MRLFEQAHFVARDLSVWERPGVPERPAMLPAADGAILDIQRKVRAGMSTSTERKIAKAAGDWKYAVLRAESQAESRLKMVLRAIEQLSEIEAEKPGSGALVVRDRLSGFVLAQYGVKAPPLPEQYPLHLGALTVRWDVLSYELRHGRARPPKSSTIDGPPPWEQRSLAEEDDDGEG